MPDLRIPELPEQVIVKGDQLIAVYDPFDDTTKRLALSKIGVGNPDDQYWQNNILYQLNEVVIADDKYWRSLVANNINNFPEEGAGFWTEISKAGADDPLIIKPVLTAPAILDLDFGKTKERAFKGDATIAGGKTVQFSNQLNAITMKFFRFELVAPGPWVFVMPANVKSDDGGFVAPNWTFFTPGVFEMFGNYDQITWNLSLRGPF